MVLCLESMKASRTPLAKIKYKYVTCTINISGQWTCFKRPAREC